MPLSLASILAESALRHADRTAVVLGAGRLTYAQLWEQARRYAAVFRDRGVNAGDRVALMIPNLPDFPRAYYGALAIGAVVVPVHSLLRASEVEYVLRDSGAKLFVGAAMLPEGLAGAALAGVDAVSLLDGPPFAPEPSFPGTPRLEKLAESAAPMGGLVEREPSDDAVILYTSGTTGAPKGALLSQFNMVMNAQVSAFDLFAVQPEDVMLGCLPLFHSFGQTCVMNTAFRIGASVVLMPRFDGAAALDLLVRENVTLFSGVPTMYLALLEAAKKDPRRPALRACSSGGSALPLAILERFEAEFGAPIYEGYGLSETSPVASFNQQAFGRKAGTVGCAIWGVDLRIADAEIENRIEFVATGEIGEVVIRGHNVFKGYLNRPEATAAVMVEGWFRSGDLGTQDADGFVSIVDRKKDMVLRGGYNVYPREVEDVLVRHPAIAQVAVIGIPDPVHGEEIVAVIVLGSETPAPAAADLIAWSKERLARYKYPRRVEFVEAFPLGPSGKVLKRELVARFS
ncbi:MAG TPA: long-chain fatty acid--CoA ligase [Candidatus Baltobacteraceae bacterium]